jgi:uncharacterized membrane protein
MTGATLDGRPAEERLQRVLGRLLLAGVRVSNTLLAIGLALWVVAATQEWSVWLMDAGLLALMATPMLRVLVSFVEYLRERDWFFVVTTLAVLVILAGGVVAALR